MLILELPPRPSKGGRIHSTLDNRQLHHPRLPWTDSLKVEGLRYEWYEGRQGQLAIVPSHRSSTSVAAGRDAAACKDVREKPFRHVRVQRVDVAVNALAM